MNLNFFEGTCQEPSISAPLFGVCDNNKAYSKLTDPNTWIATVKNDNQVALTLTAVDKCVLQDNDLPGVGRCDAMLTSDVHLYFLELKDQKKDWQQDAVDQLESTIQLFIANHSIANFRHKKAFACNRAHRHFAEIDQETNLRFFRKYSFRLDIQAEVVMV